VGAGGAFALRKDQDPQQGYRRGQNRGILSSRYTAGMEIFRE
jgi:hypothetical protein